MSGNDNARRNALNERVFHIGAGFKEREHPHVSETLSGARAASAKVHTQMAARRSAKTPPTMTPATDMATLRSTCSNSQRKPRVAPRGPSHAYRYAAPTCSVEPWKVVHPDTGNPDI
jgi:hypothetical protein